MPALQQFSICLVVRPKAGVRDPQADAVAEALAGMGYADLQVHDVGRQLRLQLRAADRQAALQMVADMCRRLLVNPHLETYDVSLDPLP